MVIINSFYPERLFFALAVSMPEQKIHLFRFIFIIRSFLMEADLFLFGNAIPHLM
jgi:hypothetical protein